MNIIKREQPRVSAYNLALRAGALINSDSGLLVYAYLLPGGVLHSPPAYVMTDETYILVHVDCMPPHTRTRYPNMYRSQEAYTELMKYCSADGAAECAQSSFENVTSCY